MYHDIQPITEADAHAETDRLFDETPAPKPKPVPTLPDDLIAHGFKLIIRGPGRGFAVSPTHGCTSTKATLRRVADEARDLVAFVEHMNRKKARNEPR
jgi:hypothetical protein